STLYPLSLHDALPIFGVSTMLRPGMLGPGGSFSHSPSCASTVRTIAASSARERPASSTTLPIASPAWRSVDPQSTTQSNPTIARSEEHTSELQSLAYL